MGSYLTGLLGLLLFASLFYSLRLRANTKNLRSEVDKLRQQQEKLTKSLRDREAHLTARTRELTEASSRADRLTRELTNSNAQVWELIGHALMCWALLLTQAGVLMVFSSKSELSLSAAHYAQS
jgi:hypothetical protein